MVAGGKKVGCSSNDQSTEKTLEGKTSEPVEQTTAFAAEATLTIMQALKLQFNSLSTRAGNQEKVDQQSANHATNEEKDEGANDQGSNRDGERRRRRLRRIHRPPPRLGGQPTRRLPRHPAPFGRATPSLFKPMRIEADLYFTEGNKTASRDDEYRHVRTKKDALDLFDTALRMFAAVGDAHEPPVGYLRCFKAKKLLTGDQVAERLIYYFRVFDPAEHECSANVVDGLLAALEDKRLESKDKTAREKPERERLGAEAKNKNDKGDKGMGKGNE
eukprot:jgi/Tetstr1/447565/TSEL_034944.t1